jgi:hypothetical protein
MHKREKKFFLIKLPKYNKNLTEYKENYYHQNILLFKCWRNEDIDLKEEKCKSYEESFLKFINSGN